MPAGEIVVLLGPSGCGKTTTLRCVAGLEHPTGGSISIAGRVVSQPARGIAVAPRQRDLGMVFQSYAVWPHMTVRQNVVYPLKHRKTSGATPAARSTRCWSWSACPEYAERPVVALSGGQMQRVALARSIVYRPKLLLLDEPLSNLDAKLRVRLRDDLRRILKAAGMTALYVTHDQAEAVVLGDRIGVMRDGKLLQMGTPDEIYNRPADLFVANFTGATNELTGTLVERNGRVGFHRPRCCRPDRGWDAAGPVARRSGVHRTAGRKCPVWVKTAPSMASHVGSPNGATRAPRRSTKSRWAVSDWKCSSSARQHVTPAAVRLLI